VSKWSRSTAEYIARNVVSLSGSGFHSCIRSTLAHVLYECPALIWWTSDKQLTSPWYDFHGVPTGFPWFIKPHENRSASPKRHKQLSVGSESYSICMCHTCQMVLQQCSVLLKCGVIPLDGHYSSSRSFYQKNYIDFSLHVAV
jgi:hypothetical protein